MTQQSSHDSLEHMEAMLRRCRRRIRVAEMSVRLREGLALFLTGLLGLAGCFLLLRALAYALDRPPFLSGRQVLGMAALFGAVIAVRALARSFLGRPIRAINAAERLDLSQATHNRIATAIALLRSGNDSTFARAAIRDGVDHLERLQAEEPHVERSTFTWRRKGAYLALSLAMIAAGLYLQGATRMSGGGPATPGTPQVAKVDHQPGLFTTETPAQPKPRSTRGARQPTGNLGPRDDDTDNKDRVKRPQSGMESQSEGPAGRHASGQSRSSQSSSDSRSAASGAGVKSKPGMTEPGKARKPRNLNKQRVEQPVVDPKNEKGGSINARGSSGSGSMRTAQNEWSSEVKARSGESDEFEQEEEPDEEMDSDKQRLGAQPALKSRTSRLSRELSLGMGTRLNNDMMKGRGGPSGQKKARGTATMIMGVPVPGFVKGRLLPGPTKSTQEEVEPSPRAGDYAVASDLPPVEPQEGPQERYRPTVAVAVPARNYLIQYHAEREIRPTPNTNNK